MLRSIWSLNISDKKILNLPVVKNTDKMRQGYDTSDFTFGYYENGLFYEDEQKTKPIRGVETELYLDISDSYVYVYNGTVSRYEFVDKLVIKFIKDEDLSIGDITDIKNVIYPKLTIMGLPGYEVTLVCGQRIISSTVGENGVTNVQLPCLGLWKVYPTGNKGSLTNVDVREIGGMYSVVLKCQTCEPCSNTYPDKYDMLMRKIPNYRKFWLFLNNTK